MRVLQLVKTDANGFGAVWAFRQMRELVRLGVDVHVALPPHSPQAAWYQEAGVVVHPLATTIPMQSPWQWPALFRALRNLVAQIQPDIVHSHFVGTTLTMRLALGKRHPIPRVFQVAGPLHLDHPFFRRAELATAGPRDAWIGTCQWTCSRLRASGISLDRIFLTYAGTDFDRYDLASRGKLRQELGVDDDAMLVGMVAFMYPPKRYLGQTRGLKGHEDFIDALALCLPHEPRLVGVVIGGALEPNAAGYERRVRRYGVERLKDRIRFLGTRDDVPALYPDLDIAVHPSLSENVGGAVESQLLAIPTIATNVGGLPDLVRPNETGWLVPPRDPQRLADAIRTALSDPDLARSLATAGQARARKLFDVRVVAQEVLQIYSAILRHTS